MNHKFDIRTLERYLREGRVTKEEYQKYLKSLPDESDRGEFVPVVPPEQKADASNSSPTFSAIREVR